MAGGRGNGSLKRRGSADVNPTAGAVVLAYLTEQVETVRSLEKAVGSLDPPSIREATVATQRLASVLASYRHLLQPEQVDSLRDDLEWLARVIIELEDIHALRGRLHVQAGEALGLAVLPAAVEHALDDREREAVRELHGALDTVRYAQLSERLDRLVRQPAFRRRAGRPAVKALSPLVRDVARAVRNAARRAGTEGLSPPESEDRLQDVRRAAQHAQYAAEVALPVGGTGAVKLVARMMQLQEILSQHRDSVVSRRVLRDLTDAVGAGTLGAADAFIIGVLAGFEQAQHKAAAASRDELLRALARNEPR